MDVIMPQLGETVAEGTITVWHKKVGDKVEADELLFEVGTDKVEMEIPASTAGVITEILVAEGETVDVGVKLAIIDDGSTAAAGTAEEAPIEEQAPAPAAPKRERAAKKGGGKRLSPVVRKMLDEHNIDATEITGTGRDGRLTRSDVQAYIDGGASSAPSSTGGTTTIPFSYRRKMIAEHMVRSKATSAHVLQAVEVDFSAVDGVRKSAGPAWKEKEGFSLTYLPFITRAVIEAIADFPNINATVDGENLIVSDVINLAIAVDLNFEGLVAPVIKNANALSVADLARKIRELADKAHADQLGPDDYAGATYTISNNGSAGTLITAPIINQPQVAILSSDGITRRPVVVERDGEEAIAIRPVGILAQSFDHRAIDGAYSGSFLGKVKQILESKDWSGEV